MYTFDSVTLVPGYSEINSRSEVDVSTTIKGVKSAIPIINANMHAICTPEMMYALSRNNSFCSYHRFFKSEEHRDQTLNLVKANTSNELFYPSIGVQPIDFKLVDQLTKNGFKNIIVDVNHGHHIKVKKIIGYIKHHYPETTVMAGNVSTNDGIKYLKDCGADIVKVGNSFGFSCTTLPSTGFGVHPFHAAKVYREETGDYDVSICIDGGIKNVSDIAKGLIYGNIVMIGKMFAGTKESHGKFITGTTKEYYGNASVVTKAALNSHVKYIEGGVKAVDYIGTVEELLKIIKEGLQSSFSFVGASNLEEYQRKAANNILEL
jgi:IMP dehydrogenase